jgi:hypothetical protein
MINMQILGGVLTALATLVGVSIALALALWASASVRHSGQAPNGGIRRDPPRQPQPDSDDDRELVLV